MQMITWDHGQSYPKFNKHSKFNQPRSQSSNQTHPSSNPSYQYKQSSKYTNTFNININPHQILYLTLSTHRHIIKFHLSSTFQSPLTSHITKMFRRALLNAPALLVERYQHPVTSPPDLFLRKLRYHLSLLVVDHITKRFSIIIRGHEMLAGRSRYKYYFRCEIQDIWLWFCHCFFFIPDRIGSRNDS
ncbi:hypothetical protein EYC84_001716 [Monilinia fructicola]|uniref:Uncharacterized protein n=1 Tax=Monilinia fructicola TaxID=38448 RepID=A0A5M9JUG0_MONFR|nr:hypothetical protein EYC84_001716 [Monilinia fructicola]